MYFIIQFLTCAQASQAVTVCVFESTKSGQNISQSDYTDLNLHIFKCRVNFNYFLHYNRTQSAYCLRNVFYIFIYCLFSFCLRERELFPVLVHSQVLTVAGSQDASPTSHVRLRDLASPRAASQAHISRTESRNEAGT